MSGSHNRSYRRTFKWLAMLTLVLNVGALAAGEAIQFGAPKGQVIADPKARIVDEKASPIQRLQLSNPAHSASATAIQRGAPRRLSAKEARRLNNAKLEKENWLLLDEGELQERDEDENNLGFGNDSKERTSGEIWFSSDYERGNRPSGQPRRGSFRPLPTRSAQAEESAADEVGFGFGNVPGSGNPPGGPGFKSPVGPEVPTMPLTELFTPATGLSLPASNPAERGTFGLRSINAGPERSVGFGDLNRVSGSSLLDVPKTPALAPPLGASRVGSVHESPKLDNLRSLTPAPSSPLQPTRSDLNRPARSGGLR